MARDREEGERAAAALQTARRGKIIDARLEIGLSRLAVLNDRPAEALALMKVAVSREPHYWPLGSCSRNYVKRPESGRSALPLHRRSPRSHPGSLQGGCFSPEPQWHRVMHLGPATRRAGTADSCHSVARVAVASAAPAPPGEWRGPPLTWSTPSRRLNMAETTALMRLCPLPGGRDDLVGVITAWQMIAKLLGHADSGATERYTHVQVEQTKPLVEARSARLLKPKFSFGCGQPQPGT
jgi:CBS domain-containing protein